MFPLDFFITLFSFFLSAYNKLYTLVFFIFLLQFNNTKTKIPKKYKAVNPTAFISNTICIWYGWLNKFIIIDVRNWFKNNPAPTPNTNAKLPINMFSNVNILEISFFSIPSIW